MRAWNYIQKTLGSTLEIKIIKQTHKIMMHKEKHRDGIDVLVGEYRKSSAFAGWHIFAPVDLIERYMEDAISRFHEIQKDDPIMAAINLFGNIIIIYIYIYLKWKRKNLLLDFGSYFDVDEMLANFKLLS